jgi:hypothetical protein
MQLRTILFFAITVGFAAIPRLALAQTTAPIAAAPVANTIATSAGGIQITFVPGSGPVLTATSTGEEKTPVLAPGLAVASTKTVRFIDQHGRDIDPKTIKPTERLQPLYDSGPAGAVLQTVMVDRD